MPHGQDRLAGLRRQYDSPPPAADRLDVAQQRRGLRHVQPAKDLAAVNDLREERLLGDADLGGRAGLGGEDLRDRLAVVAEIGPALGQVGQLLA